jgi:hypothetical protein
MNRTLTSSTSKLSNPWLFFAVTFAWTWSFWILAVLLGLSADTSAGLAMSLLGVLGPMVAGIGLTYLTCDQTGRRDYWRRVIDLKRIGAKWYLVILLFVPILNILAALFDMLLGGSGATWGGEMVAITERADTIAGLLWIVAAIGIVVLWGPNTFTRKQEAIQ